MSWLAVLVAQVVVANAQQESIVLGVEIHEACGDEALVVARHLTCWNATPVPWFPARVMSTNTTEGTLTVVYGWDSSPAARWNNETLLPAVEAQFCPGLADQWLLGDPGRGYAYVPECESSACAVRCVAMKPGSCLQGEEFEIGEVCTVQCPEGMNTTNVNLTCDVSAPLEDRTSVCEVPTIYCDDLEGYAAYAQYMAAVNESNNTVDETTIVFDPLFLTCVIEATTTTTTTIPPESDEDRFLYGCSELQQLRQGELSPDPEVPPLPIGMPGVQLQSGAYYYEVILEGPWEQVGWVDAEWTAGENPEKDQEHQFFSANGGPGIVGAAVLVRGRGLAEFWFSRDGDWQGGGAFASIPTTEFSPPLSPAALLRGRSTWVLPYVEWMYFPPLVRYKPITQRIYPSACRFPLDYAVFGSPPACEGVFEQLNTSMECSEAAFHFGLEDWTVTQKEFPGWPAGCFFCSVCDLSGNLYLNNATDTQEQEVGFDGATPVFEYTANQSLAVCRRRDPSRTKTVTTTTGTAIAKPTLMPPLYGRFSEGVCGTGYVPITSHAECEAVAAELGLPDTTARNVTLGGDGSLIYWPPGCFHCGVCDSGSLFLNINNGSWEFDVKPGDAVPAEPLCRATPEIRTTGPPTTTLLTTPVPTEPPEEEVETTVIFYETTVETTTVMQAIDVMGFVVCEDPYEELIVLNWWERLEVILGGVAGFILCCCCPCFCWFFGVCDFVAHRAELFMETHPRLKNSCCCRAFYCCGRCVWRSCPCLRALAAISPRHSPRGDSPRGAGQIRNSKALTRASTGSKEKSDRQSRSRSNSKEGPGSRNSSKEERDRRSTSKEDKRGSQIRESSKDKRGSQIRESSKDKRGSQIRDTSKESRDSRPSRRSSSTSSASS